LPRGVIAVTAARLFFQRLTTARHHPYYVAQSAHPRLSGSSRKALGASVSSSRKRSIAGQIRARLAQASAKAR